MSANESKEMTETQRENWLKCLEKRRQNIAKRAEEKLAKASEERDLAHKKRKVLNEVSKQLDKRDLPEPDEIIVPQPKKSRALDPWQDREDRMVNRIVTTLKDVVSTPAIETPEEEQEEQIQVKKHKRPYVRKKPYVPRSNTEPCAPSLQEAQIQTIRPAPNLMWI
jgi:hypothetical protein